MREDGEKGAGLDGRVHQRGLGGIKRLPMLLFSCEFAELFCVGDEYAVSWQYSSSDTILN